MLIHNCLRSLENLNAKVRRRRASRTAPKPPSVQPVLEPLESRIVLNSSTATITNAAGALTITDTIAAQVSITESLNAKTGTNYTVTVTDGTGTTGPTIETGVKSITVNLSGNGGVKAPDTVTLTRTSGAALTGNLAITDGPENLDKLSVSIGPGFNVNGNVTINAVGAGSAVGVTSSSDKFGGNVTVNGGPAAASNPSAGPSLVSLSNDQIAGNVAATLTAGAPPVTGNGEAVNLVNDQIGGNATITEKGVASSTGEAITVSDATINGGTGLTVTQTSSQAQSLTVNNGSSVGVNLAVKQTGTLNAAITLAGSSVGGNVKATQQAVNANATVSSSASVAGNALFVQKGGNNATTSVGSFSSVGSLTITQTDAGSNTANVANSHDGGALKITQGSAAGFLSPTNNIALSGNLVVIGATTLTQASAGTNTIGIDDSELHGVTNITQEPNAIGSSQANSVEFGSGAGDLGMTLFGNKVTVTQGVAGTNTDTIAASEFVAFAATTTFTLDTTMSTNSITDTLANTFGFNNLTSNVPITVL